MTLILTLLLPSYVLQVSDRPVPSRPVASGIRLPNRRFSSTRATALSQSATRASPTSRDSRRTRGSPSRSRRRSLKRLFPRHPRDQHAASLARSRRLGAAPSSRARPCGRSCRLERGSGAASRRGGMAMGAARTALAEPARRHASSVRARLRLPASSFTPRRFFGRYQLASTSPTCVGSVPNPSSSDEGAAPPGKARSSPHTPGARGASR